MQHERKSTHTNMTTGTVQPVMRPCECGLGCCICVELWLRLSLMAMGQLHFKVWCSFRLLCRMSCQTSAARSRNTHHLTSCWVVFWRAYHWRSALVSLCHALLPVSRCSCAMLKSIVPECELHSSSQAIWNAKQCFQTSTLSECNEYTAEATCAFLTWTVMKASLKYATLVLG